MHVRTSAFKPLSITTGSSMMPSRRRLVEKTGPLTTPSRDGGILFRYPCAVLDLAQWPLGQPSRLPVRLDEFAGPPARCVRLSRKLIVRGRLTARKW
ncbi:hypothetical protein FA95DRAFT_1566965 [Auriscalpium vulgare]|uniref:Uncharacterized protein n=1 Tax=Auriscalpium vulgare TaxID=40419 RepID=A0ACB8R6G8_9AGAM|nr:hypothetical protein FA95DRAFT_1566965 [Auriscalpium vulgare]